jgi:hypothetical protein
MPPRLPAGFAFLTEKEKKKEEMGDRLNILLVGTDQ